jgi:hypothetical protein
VQAVHPDQVGFVPRQFDRLAGGATLREGILAGRSPRRIADGWVTAQREFALRRASVLLYP